MQGIPGGGQVPRARGIRQVPTRGVAGQQSQPTGPGGASQPLVQVITVILLSGGACC